MTTATLELSLPVALSMFSDLVGKKVTGAECEPGDLTGADATLRGVFVADAQAPGALYLFDLELAAALGTALVMMPAGLVRQSVSDGALVPALVENCFEVLNVSSRLVNRAGGVHYQLREQVLPGVALPEDAAGIVEGYAQRVDLELSVESYGDGRLVILVA